MRSAAGASDVGGSSSCPVEWDPQPAEFQLQITGDAQAGYTIGGDVRRDGHAHAFADVLFVTAALILWRPAEPGRLRRVWPRSTRAAPIGGWRGCWTWGRVTVPAAEAAALARNARDLGSCAARVPRRAARRRARRTAAAVRPHHAANRLPRLQPRPAIASTRSCRSPTASVTSMRGRAQPVFFDRERRLAWRRDPAAERAALARLQSLGVRRLADWQTRRHAAGPRRKRAADARPRAHLGGLARRSRGPALSPARHRHARRAVRHRLVRAARRRRLRRRQRRPAHAARRGAARRHLRRRSATAPSDCCRRTGSRAPGAWPRSARPRRDHVRFASCQGALLDAWLATQPAVSCDEAFARARGELARFEGVGAVDPPPTFHGVLRDYQRDALGWFEFLRRFGFGGCLADEMGLGKTVMVLAALEARRLERERAGHRARVRRSSSCRARSCSTGSRRRRASRRRCACSTSRAAAGATPSTASPSTTSS